MKREPRFIHGLPVEQVRRFMSAPPVEREEMSPEMRERFEAAALVLSGREGGEQLETIIRERHLLEGLLNDLRREREGLRALLTEARAERVWVEERIEEIEQIAARATGMHAARAQEIAQVVPRGRPPFKQIIRAVALDAGLTVQSIVGSRRWRRVVRARQVAAWLIRALRPDKSLSAIGRALGGRDHTSVLYAVRRVEVSPELHAWAVAIARRNGWGELLTEPEDVAA